MRVSRRLKRRATARRRPAGRRWFEQLESRRLLTIVVDNTNDTGPGSLRAAIEQANQSADVIVFEIPATDPNFVDLDSGIPGGDPEPDVFVISPRTALPAISNSVAGVIIDGTTQAVFGGDANSFGPEIVIDGSNVGEPSDGLRIISPDSRVIGLVIQSFDGHGISIDANRVDVFNNYVGVDGTGTGATGNSGSGILIGIGNDSTISNNVIAFNGQNGIGIRSATGVSIRQNSIHSNALLGIDLELDGVTANDPGDTDQGANNLQNYPVLTDIQRGPVVTVTGELNSAPDQTFEIALFANDDADASGFGEGQEFIMSFFVTTDENGLATFVQDLVLAFPDRLITATATDALGNTSEFSRVNRPPVAVDKNFGTDEDTPLNANLLLNAAGGSDMDPDGDPLTVVAINGEMLQPGQPLTLPSGATLTVTEDGQFEYDPRTSPTLNALDFDEFATESFTYTISDGFGSRDSATIDILVDGINDAPTGVADSYTTDEDIPLNVDVSQGVLANDTDPESNGLFATVVTPPANAADFVLNLDGSFSYTPLPDFAGTDSFTYRVSDDGERSDVVDVMLSIVPVADPPQVSVPSFLVGDENEAIPIGISAALLDDDGSESLTILVQDLPPDATLSQGQDLGDGTWQLDPSELDGLLLTVPDNADFTLTVLAQSTEELNGDEAVNSATANVSIANLAPVVDLQGPTFAFFGESLDFVASATDASPVDEAAGFTYSIDWGDGSPIEEVQGAATGVTLSHVYDIPDSYVITVAAIDKDGARGDDFTLDVEIGFETLVSLDDGTLVIEDVVDGGKDDLLEIRFDAASQEIVISDPAHAVGNTVGTFSPTEIRVAAQLVTGGQVVVRTFGGDDRLSFDHSDLEFPFPTHFDGGADADLLVLTGSAADIVSHTFQSSAEGSVDIDGIPISYEGLEPIEDDIVAAQRRFVFAGPSELVTLDDNSVPDDGLMSVDSTEGETVEFRIPTGLLELVVGNGDDVATVAGLDSAFRASLTVHSDTGGFDTVVVDGFGSGLPQDLSLQASGRVELNASVAVAGSATMSAGAILLRGDLSAAGQVFDGPVVVESDVTLDSQDAVTFRDTIDGGSELQGSLTVSAPGQILFDGGVGQTVALQNLEVSSTTSLNLSSNLTVVDTLFVNLDGPEGTTQELTFTEGASITSTDGSVLLEIGDLVLLPAGSSLSAADSIVIGVDRVDQDPEGGQVTLSGDVVAPAVDIFGGDDNDRLLADDTVTADLVMFGAGGDDVIQGGGGNDVLLGLEGNDVLDGQLGDDVLDGGGGQDVLTDALGYNLLIGGSGVDDVNGGSGEDLLIGADTVYGQLEEPVDTLRDILAVWSGPGTIDERITALANLETPLTLETLVDDGDIDRLVGLDAADLFFGFAGDRIIRPRAVDDEFTILEDSDDISLDVLANDLLAPEAIDRVVDGGLILTITQVGETDQGGSVEVTEDAAALVYRPAPDFAGSETFTYTIGNGDDEGTSTATVTIVVENVEDNPIATENKYRTDERTVLNGNLISDDTGSGIDSDPDKEDFFQVVANTEPDSGASLTIEPDGSFTYDPTTSPTLEALLTGEALTETFTYTIQDRDGLTSTATVTIVVDGVDPAMSGQVWDDLNDNGQRDPGEPGLPGWTVFLDGNGSRTLDVGERTATTDAGGNYRFEIVPPGQYDVTFLLENQFEPTFPRRRFEPGSTVPAGIVARGAVGGDWNDDGRPDLAVADDLGGNVVVLMNDDENLLTDGATLSVGARPQQVVATDINGDSALDLVVAAVGSPSDDTGNAVYLLLGDGDGGFGAPSIVQAGDGPLNLAAGDLDGDGDVDLAVVNFRSRNVSLLLNLGNGVFSAPRNVPAGDSPIAIAIADVVGDSLPDLLVANFDSDSLHVLANQGDGTFSTVRQLPVADGPSQVSVSDLNGDGRSDVMVAGYLADAVTVLLAGDQGFQPGMNVPVGARPRTIAVADANGDGHADLFVSNSESGTVSVVYGDGLGGFPSMFQYAADMMGPQSAVTGDWDQDGDEDIAVAGLPGRVTSLLNGVGVYQVQLSEFPVKDLDFGNLFAPTAANGGEPVEQVFQNQLQPEDVDANGEVQPLDVLMIFNELNEGGARPLPTGPAAADGEGESGGGAPSAFVDVNGDSFLSPVDGLLVINWLNDRVAAAAAIDVAEAESGHVQSLPPVIETNEPSDSVVKAGERTSTDERSLDVTTPAPLVFAAPRSDTTPNERSCPAEDDVPLDIRFELEEILEQIAAAH